MEVTDINSVQQALKNKGGAITDGPITLPDGAVMLFIRDQDKSAIEFHHPYHSHKESARKSQVGLVLH